MNNKPLILITNDDGIDAPGIRKLIDIMLEIGEVVVVAPDGARSAMSQAITINSMITLSKIKTTRPNLTEYKCSGTPADCVKMALNEILDRKPDLCVSGINHGTNASINVVYSGTMGAALEAGIGGIPAIGFSLLDYRWNACFDTLSPFIKKIVLNVLQHKLPADVVLNVNIPDKEDIKGIKICKQAKSKWIEKFDKRKSPMGKTYYWLTGNYEILDPNKETDEHALAEGYISIVPTQFDLTAHSFIEHINTWDFEL